MGAEVGIDTFVPDLDHCMDNAAMIAQAGAQRLAAGNESPPTLDADSNLQL
jgi:N6-L-threonylcarbamoyladenine synthase